MAERKVKGDRGENPRAFLGISRKETGAREPRPSNRIGASGKAKSPTSGKGGGA